MAITTSDSIAVRENFPVGSSILDLDINDDDPDLSFIYSLEGAEDVFSIDADGLIILADSLDFETTERYDITATVTENQRSSSQQIIVQVTNVEDEVPPGEFTLGLLNDNGTSDSDGITNDPTILGTSLAADFSQFQISIDNEESWITISSPDNSQEGGKSFDGTPYFPEEKSLSKNIIPTEVVELEPSERYRGVADADNFLEESHTFPDAFYFDITTPSELATGKQNGLY